jgi:hypothetical protein
MVVVPAGIEVLVEIVELEELNNLASYISAIYSSSIWTASSIPSI